MAFKFTLEDTNVDDSTIFKGITGRIKDLTDDAEIVIKGGRITNSQLFSNLNITEFCSKVESQQKTLQMSKEERASLQSILKQKENKKLLWKAFVNISLTLQKELQRVLYRPA